MDTASLASPALLPAMILLAALLGAVIGSFITLATYRLPLGQPIGMTRSRCPNCSTLLRVPDLVPMLSWALARGRCRHCHTSVSIRYPLTELACAAGAGLLVAQYGLQWETLALMGLWWCVVAIFVTDLEHYIILDEVQLLIGLFGLLYVWAAGLGWLSAAIGAISGLAIGLVLKYGFLAVRHKDGLGMGDVKFLAVAGIWLADAANFVPFLFYAGLLGIVSGIGWRMLGQGERFPFGPALALALMLCVVFPPAADGFWSLYGVIHE